MNATFEEAVAPYLNPTNAELWADAEEKYLWVVYNVLDEIGWRTTDAAVEYVEDRLTLIYLTGGY
ncbi:MAG: hypothetical protein EAZ84_09815 [Verrucomicrobia bacterium]|nr:MAG: hypothetical protein EAZ84_09815 [Verrucomicrobiota bacterium]